MRKKERKEAILTGILSLYNVYKRNRIRVSVATCLNFDTKYNVIDVSNLVKKNIGVGTVMQSVGLPSYRL